MGDERSIQFADLLITCHGSEAEKIARQRARKCLERGETGWAELYAKVAEEIARRQRHPAVGR
jgi:hypothetical protein